MVPKDFAAEITELARIKIREFNPKSVYLNCAACVSETNVLLSAEERSSMLPSELDEKQWWVVTFKNRNFPADAIGGNEVDVYFSKYPFQFVKISFSR